MATVDYDASFSPDGQWIVFFSSSRLGYRDEAPLYDAITSQPYAELFIMRAITDDKWQQSTPASVP